MLLRQCHKRCLCSKWPSTRLVRSQMSSYSIRSTLCRYHNLPINTNHHSKGLPVLSEVYLVNFACDKRCCGCQRIEQGNLPFSIIYLCNRSGKSYSRQRLSEHSPMMASITTHLKRDLSSSSFCFAASALSILPRFMLRSAKFCFLRCRSSIFSSKLCSMMKRYVKTSLV